MTSDADAQAQRPFVLGGSLRRRGGADSARTAAAMAAIATVVAIPLRGLYRGTGASMEEGFMLVFPRLVQQGKLPNRDFLHLYGPTSLDALALWFRVFGDSLESQRTFGLLQHLAIVAAVYTIARAAGHLAATLAGGLTAVLVLAPIGLTALAWHGAIALGLWSVAFALRARAIESVRSGQVAWRSWWGAGGCAGLALGFRPDVVVALGLALGVALWRRPRALAVTSVGAAVGLLPMWYHLAIVGPRAAIEGMLIDPVVRLRPGRTLPSPPSWNRLDGALQAVAESLPPWWRLPALTASRQLFVWFFAVIVIALAVPIVAAWRRRRASSDDPAAAVGDVLLIAGLFGAGIVQQAIQRPDSTHLAWVAMVSWPMAAVLLADVARRRLGRAAVPVAGCAALATLLIVCPFFTLRTYLLNARVSIGNLPVPFEIERGGRRFWVGDPAVAAGIGAMMTDLDRLAAPGDRLFVGPGDLRKTVYADTYIYWLYPELEPSTYFIEMDPGIADRAGSGMAEEIASSDFVVLTNTWSGWVEPNESSTLGSDEHNRAVADHFCLVESYVTNLVLLFERCDGGGGLDPATVAGRAEGIGQGGVEATPP